MTSLPIKLGATLAVSILGLAAGFAVTKPPPSDAAPPRTRARAEGEAQLAPPVSVLAQLGLDELQRERIERLRARERGRVELLQRALATTEQELRREELSSPFDAARVNALVARQAELTAYLRGTESRVVSEIAEVLTSEQQRRFAELRTADSPPRRGPRGDRPQSRGELEARSGAAPIARPGISVRASARSAVRVSAPRSDGAVVRHAEQEAARALG